MKKNYKYYVIYKPYGMLSQFTDKEGREVLKNLYPFPPDVYAAGRLDRDSEGLLLLTNDRKLTDYMLNPKNGHEREYYVQVEGRPSEGNLDILRTGVVIEGRKTLPAKVRIIEEPDFEPRVPPIRVRKSIPDSWISLTLTEGRNRQVRKMTAAAGFPTLRLVRVRIELLKLNGMKPGDVREVTPEQIFGKYKPGTKHEVER